LDNYDEELMWMCHWVEDGTKGDAEIWEMLHPELIDPLKEYMEIHRKILVDRGPGAVSLFVTNGGRDMHKDYMIDLLAELSLRYSDTGKRLSPHIVRDIVVEHALANGCTFEEVQQMLWHKRAKSTQRYMSGFNASHASVVLEKNLATPDIGRI
jgi:site-specific recombinase XerD